MTDYKALCRELVWLDQAEPGDYANWKQAWSAAIKRARAALAEPEPEGPTRRQLMMLADDMGMARVGEAAEYARAVLDRWG